jgi:hypothetical protein
MRMQTSDLATSGLGALAAPVQAGHAGAGTAFAAKLAAASSTKSEDAAGEAKAKAKGETTRKVDGKPLLEVTSGPRNGMFINKTGNARDGEAFALIRRTDHDLHVYGTGKDRRVIVVPHDGEKAAAPTDIGKGKERTAKVDGHTDYVEVMSGPRNGMFINRSGNARDGEAFVLVKRKDHELHIYGTGKDRRVIVARYGDEAGKADGDKAVTTPATGGAAAPAGDDA